MKKYFCLQLKRVWKVFPFVLAVILILFIGLLTIFSGMMHAYNSSEEQQRFKIAITGDTNSKYLDWGMSMLQSIDETRFALDFVEMTEEGAEKALSSGDISAYVVLPRNFIKNALHGKVKPIKYVTTPGAGGVISMFKNEITELVTDMVIYSQKGTYGIDEAVMDNDVSDPHGKYMQDLSVEYVDLILARSELYTVEELGVWGGLSMEEYYICGIIVLLLMLIGLPYVMVHVKKDFSLNRLLYAKGCSSFGQMMCEYFAHLMAMLLPTSIIFIVVKIAYNKDASFFLRAIPVVVMIAAFNIMLFELSGNMVSSVLIHFFTSLCLCYISGCFYPIYAFPNVIQRMSLYLPTGIARNYLAGSFTGENVIFEFLGIFTYAIVFFGIAFATRHRKIVNRRGWDR